MVTNQNRLYLFSADFGYCSEACSERPTNVPFFCYFATYPVHVLT